ncbi:hypothetical protein [Derxia lacustris]|uniref:hypothetical protein n=1 Tax=Derxia lacustris TaxID=764842 RepID=UPI000A175E02|nr:hypothetical protein [Derxia lacustris]
MNEPLHPPATADRDPRQPAALATPGTAGGSGAGRSHAAQRALAERIDSSPRMTAQRAALGRLLPTAGAPVQAMTSIDAGLLRRRFEREAAAHGAAEYSRLVDWDALLDDKHRYSEVFDRVDAAVAAFAPKPVSDGPPSATKKKAQPPADRLKRAGLPIKDKRAQSSLVTGIGQAPESEADAPILEVVLPPSTDEEAVKIKDGDGALRNNLKVVATDSSRHGKPPEGKEPERAGYLGLAIVYSGENDAANLATRYVTGSQRWPEAERQRRLGVSFGINSKQAFDGKASDQADKVRGVAKASAASVGKLVSSEVNGFTWGYSYELDGIGTVTTLELGRLIETGSHGGKTLRWVSVVTPESDEEDALPAEPVRSTVTDKEAIRAAFNQQRNDYGVPYGFLRGLVTDETAGLEAHLTRNGAKPVYLHSLDADAPDFETLTRDPQDEEQWLPVLEAYDQIVDARRATDPDALPDMVIGGYNLTADPDHYAEPDDYRHTVRSNAVDLAIRQAVHEVAPTLTYPTEPNFLIRSDTYAAARKSKTGRAPNPWGTQRSEGRAVYNAAIRGLAGRERPIDAVYAPLASVPTGIDANGVRLRVEASKTYTADSVAAAPRRSAGTAAAEQSIPLDDQYVFQAQSFSGANRLATALAAALEAAGLNNLKGSDSPLDKDLMIEAFSEVETMVFEVFGSRPPAEPDYTVAQTLDQRTGLALRALNAKRKNEEPTGDADTAYMLAVAAQLAAVPLLKAIHARLVELVANEGWKALSE